VSGCALNSSRSTPTDPAVIGIEIKPITLLSGDIGDKIPQGISTSGRHDELYQISQKNARAALNSMQEIK
jgi:hypothetical protein